MKISPNILLVTLCLAICLPAVIYSTIDNDGLMADERPQPQATKIDDLTYFVLVFAENEFYIDQFEFEAGDKFILTSRKGDYTGIWSAVDLLTFTYFTAKIEVTKTSSSTTTTASTTGANLVGYSSREAEKMSDYLVNIWGFANTLPPPFESLSSMIGAGAYLGADAFFLGFTLITTEPTFGSIKPDKATQGDKNVAIEVTGLNTEFESGNTEVGFTPSDGITVKNIDVDDKTTVNFDIDVDFDAPTGTKSVTVTYPGGSITGTNKFTIEKFTGTTTTSTTTP